MYTRIQICNRALAKIGHFSIMSLDDASDAAVILNSMYDVVRDAELSANRWGFALTRALLPALEESPAFGFARKYPLPVDCLRLVEVGRVWPVDSRADYRFGPDAPWEVEGGTVLCDLPAPLPVRYIRREENPERYPATFVEALSCKLAVEICPRIAGKNSAKESLWQEYKFAIAEAKRVNAIQKAPQRLQDGAWMLSRAGTTGIAGFGPLDGGRHG